MMKPFACHHTTCFMKRNFATTALRTPMLGLSTYLNKNILVTGGGTGLGKSIANRYAELGANVIIASRKLDILESAKKDIIINSKNENIHCFSLDVRSQKDIATLISKLDNLNLFPDVIVNNAAGNFISPTERLSSNAINTVIDIVLKGTINVTHAFGKHMITNNKKGVFLNISATYGQTGCSFVVPSAIAKAGCDNLIKSLSPEWGKHDIRLLGVAPGPIYTKGAFSRLDPSGQFVKKLIKNIPLSRLGTCDELANIVTYLTSDYASWMTGTIVNFDGGETSRNAGFLNNLSTLSDCEWDSIINLKK